ISNALKFTLKGEVRVRAMFDADDTVTFSVSDTGIGISQDELSLIFEDFTQIDSPVQRRLRGTGLGLAVSKRFARLLGGDVSAISTPGQGSTFSLSIPITMPESRAT